METTKQLCEAAIKTKEQYANALLLDNMLLAMEEKMGLLDGIPVEDWIINEVSE